MFGALSLRAYAAGVWVCKGGKWEIEGEGKGRGCCVYVGMVGRTCVAGVRACVRACSLALTLCVRALALSLAFAGEGRGLLQRQRRTADIELRPVSPQWVTATGRSPACSALATRPALFFVQGRDTFSEAWPPVHEMRDRKTTRLHLPLHLLFPPVLSE